MSREHRFEARRELCRRLSWPGAYDGRPPVPPGFTEHVSAYGEFSYETSVPLFCRAVAHHQPPLTPLTFLGMIQQMAIKSYIVRPEGWSGPMTREDEERTAEGFRAHQHSLDTHFSPVSFHHRFLEKSPPWNPTLRNIFEKELNVPQAWTYRSPYLGILREFIPRILMLDLALFPSLDSPLLPEHIQLLGSGALIHHGSEPYSASAIARDDGTRQEIVDHNEISDGEFETFDSDDEYPMEEPLSGTEIQKRDKCSKVLQLLEGVMDSEDRKLCEGTYLEMCNILKELYDQ
jgi:hypothetical protein